MNKYQEALNSIEEKTTKIIEHCLPAIKIRYCGDEVDILRELVEKATPKKICHTKEEGSFTFNFGRCECGREILSANDYVKYCPCCGQALDWRVEDEKI